VLELHRCALDDGLVEGVQARVVGFGERHDIHDDTLFREATCCRADLVAVVAAQIAQVLVIAPPADTDPAVGLAGRQDPSGALARQCGPGRRQITMLELLEGEPGRALGLAEFPQ